MHVKETLKGICFTLNNYGLNNFERLLFILRVSI